MEKILNACLLMCLVILYGSARGQEDTAANKIFKIADYKPVEFVSQSLNVTPSLSFRNYTTIDSSLNRKTNDQNTSGNFQSDISHWMWKHKRATDLELSNRLSLYASPGATNNRIDDGNRNYRFDRNNGKSISYSFVNRTRYRRYLNGGLFLEGAVSPAISQNIHGESFQESGSLYPQSDTQSYYSHQKDTSLNTSLKAYCEFQASAGLGWIADVTSANVASYILDRIKHATGSRPTLSSRQMTDFSSYIDQLRRRRIFDYALESIETVDSLCQFLLREKILDRETARLGMELDYAWTYGFYQPRYSGKEFRCSPFAKVVYSFTKLPECSGNRGPVASVVSLAEDLFEMG